MIIFIIAVVFIILYVRVLEFRSLYIPYRDVSVNPSEVGLVHEEIALVAFDGPRLSAWYVPGRTAEKVIYFLHGNGGNISHRLEKIRFFHDLGYSVFILDYRGYGRSTGFPSEKGLYADARAGYDYLTTKRRFPPGALVVYGESLGAAVAVDLASKAPVGALILEGAFTSVPGMGKSVYPFIPPFLLASRYDTSAKIGHVACPVAFIHSRNDEIVPFEMAQSLYEACRTQKIFLATTGGHNEHFMIHMERLKDGLKPFLSR
ncbi:MAG: alpha/beta hydrolase [Candidatus Omnitrophica bacterium]|nr:alpha/beta hydrolase [Candidatus Omnitrophota bacterium]MDD5574770.1 alpha/beta hydrolase [Candidatus Omnitrophota bacterium]